MNTLATYIADQNAKTQAWIDAAPGRWAGLLTDDLAYWAEVGITTPEELELYLDQATYSDLYKEVHGYRPRFDTTHWTREDWKNELDQLHREAEIEFDLEAQRAADAVDYFEARLEQTIESGAGDRATALRWMWQAENDVAYSRQDLEGFAYNWGILFTDVGKQVVDELEQVVEYHNFDDHVVIS